MGNKLSEKTAQTYANTPNAEYTTKWEYNYAGLVTKTINALGDFTTSSYDGLQRFISAADYVSNSQTTPYYTTYMYDAVGRILKESIPFHQDGSMMEYSVKTYGYDANGNVTASKITTNKPGEAETKSVTTYSYNNRDQMIRTQTGSDFTTYTYDAAGNPLTVTTANGEAVTGYAYDHLGNLTTMTDAMGQKETHTYDLNGNLLTTTDRNGNVTAFTYDDLGRQVNVQVKSAAGTLLSSKQTAYTLTGQTLSEQNDTATVTWKYDALGRMTQESETGGVVKNYTYNLADLRTGYQLLVGGAQKMNTTYTYDQMNRLSTVLENGAQAASYTYDKNGNRATMTNGNGTTVTYAYNAANLVTSLQNKKGLSTLSNYVYQYYLDGNQAQKNDHTGRSTSYAYDAQRRLTQEAESGAADAVTRAYRFDEAGNRLSMTVTGAESYTTNYTYDRNNRLLTETRTSGGTQQVTDYTYDANGNTQTKTTGASSEQYTYDGFNRLVKVVNAAGTTTYDYRPDGLRNSKTVAGVKTAHIWDGQNMSAELNASGAILRAYIRGVGLIAEDDAAGTRQYALYNAHGDVVQLSNTNGVVTREYQYDAFGNERNPDAADVNPFRYCGEYFDAETGDIYLRARYYDPAIGRFTQMDTHWNPGNMIYGDNPIKVNPNQDILGLNTYTYIADITAIMQSGNKYVYCMDDPMNCFDPSGDAGQTVSIGSGWYCRIDPEIEGVNQRHIHIWNDRKRFAQNIDGSPHDKDKNDRGNPPKWVRKAIKDSKKLGNWDWDAQHKKFFNDAEISLSDGPMYYKYPNGTIIYIPYSYCLSAEDAYYSKNLTIDPENPKVFYIFNVSPITVPMPNFNPLPVVI